MIDRNDEDRIRVRAHEIWERQGRPEGQHDAHWDQARQEIEGEQGQQRVEEPLIQATGLATETASGDALPGGQHSTDAAEGDREVVERQLSRSKDSRRARGSGKSSG